MNSSDVPKTELIIMDVGRQKRRAIEDLKQGIGPLADEVYAAARTAAENLKTEKVVTPVVILYRKRARKRRGLIAEILGNK